MPGQTQDTRNRKEPFISALRRIAETDDADSTRGQSPRLYADLMTLQGTCPPEYNFHLHLTLSLVSFHTAQFRGLHDGNEKDAHGYFKIASDHSGAAIKDLSARGQPIPPALEDWDRYTQAHFVYAYGKAEDLKPLISKMILNRDIVAKLHDLLAHRKSGTPDYCNDYVIATQKVKEVVDPELLRLVQSDSSATKAA